MPDKLTDNEIWPVGEKTADASKLLEATSSLVADAVADPNVKTNSLRDDFLKILSVEFGPITKITDLPTITELTAEPVKWVIDRMLPYGCLTMVVGSQGSMKTMLAMYAAQRIAGHIPGQTFLGRKVMHGVPVLYIDRENPEAEVSGRARYMGIEGNKNFIYWGDFNKKGQTPEVDDPRLLEWAHKHNLLIVFDSLQDWYGDENENDNSAMVKLLGKFRKLARAGAGVLLLHHKNAAGERARGGTSITNLTDMAIKASKNADDPSIIELREERFRMCGGWEIDLKAHWDAGAFHNFSKHYQLELLRDQLASEVVRDKKAEQAEKAQAKGNKDSADTVRILEMARTTGLSPGTIGNKLSIYKGRVDKLLEKAGVTYADGSWQGLEKHDEVY
jgi:KaiC/GvpD/RAD55 family RecA-like ATPase